MQTYVQSSGALKRIAMSVLAVAVMSATLLGTRAAFTAQDANSGNGVATGTLRISSSAGNSAILSGSNMRPGDVRTGTVTITNSGSLQSTMALAGSDIVGTGPPGNELHKNVDLCIDDPAVVGACDAYDGKLVDYSSSSMGAFESGESKTIRFTMTVPSGLGNDFQGTNASATFTWTAA